MSGISEYNPVVIYTNLVQCGTPNGGMVTDRLSCCRSMFFDNVVKILQPGIVLAVGRYASENIYWNDTISGKSGAVWDGLRKRHATSEDAVIGGHKCRVIFALQPGSRVSMEKRNAAKETVREVYLQKLPK